MARKIRKNDDVYVISGAARGSRGTILRVDTEKNRVFVQGVNLRTCRVKPSVKNPEGGTISREMSIHISNVALVDPKNTQEPCRVGFKINDKGEKIRFSKKSGADIPYNL